MKKEYKVEKSGETNDEFIYKVEETNEKGVFTKTMKAPKIIIETEINK